MKKLIERNYININVQDFFDHIKLSCQKTTIINEIAKRKIIEFSAEEAGIKVEAPELQQAADSFRIENKLQNTDDTWTWLNKHHLSLDDFETLVYINALTEKLAQHLFADNVEPWFYGHQLDYSAAALYEVIVEEEDLAMELFCRLQEKESCFQEIARQHIQDLSLRRAGGYLGLIYRRDLQPEISAAVFEASPPQILKPIKTHRGNHLIVVEEIVESKLDDELRAQIISDLFAVWLDEQTQKIQFEIDIPEFQLESTRAVAQKNN